MMVSFLILFCILFIAIMGKWLILALLLPSLKAYGIYQKDKTNMIAKLLAVPFNVINKWSRGGYILWISYRVGLVSSKRFRLWFYRLAGAEIAKKVTMHIGIQVRSPWKLKIGRGTIVGDHVTLDARSNLEIGNNVNISSNVSIWTLQHDYRDSEFSCPSPEERKLDVKIEDRVWLGCNVIVLPGVTIGEGAVCCGGCVVTKDVPPFTVVAGIPAKKVGNRPANLIYEFSGKSCKLY